MKQVITNYCRTCGGSKPSPKPMPKPRPKGR